MKSLSAKMNSLGFMAEGYESEGWVGRMFTKIKVLLLLEAEDLPELEEPCEPKKLCHDRRHPWTDVHSWYAVMGGLAFEDTAAEEFQFMPGARSRMTLGHDLVIWLAENQAQSLPDVSKQHIEDKSKSGGLGKFLTCWQASYFCAQCAFRLSQQYSISLLELNVFAHALCALILFWLWWDKPQNVSEPTLITDKVGLDLCAYYSLTPPVPIRRDFFGIFALLESYLVARWVPCEPCSNYWDVVVPAVVTMSFRYESSSPNPYYDRLFLFGPNRQPCLKVQGSFWTIETINLARYTHWREEEILNLDNRDIWRLTRAYGPALAYRKFERRPTVVDRCANLFEDWKAVLLLFDFHDLFIENLFSPRSGRNGHTVWLAVGLTLAGGCYGGLHLTAWACQFPSYAETMLWRAANITILATGPSVIGFVLSIAITNDIAWSARQWLEAHRFRSTVNAMSSLQSVAHLMARALCLLWGLWYILCRVFIVVECFIMLAHLPESTLEIPTWARYIPHIT